MLDTRSTQRPCPVCENARTEVFIEIPSVPVLCNVLWPSRAAALAAPRGALYLTFCPACGHVFNAAFDPALITYDQVYENSLHFSPRFQQYALSLADRLIERHALRGKQVVEIGCGKGDFLQMLCERGDNHGLGFDPSYEPALGANGAARFEVVQDLYSEKYAHHRADLVCCRHVLEHVEAPRAFVGTVRRAVERQATTVFFEVPNVLATLRDLAVWDLIYEHFSYFSPASMAHLFEAEGFGVTEVREAFGGQYLCLEAVPGPAAKRPDMAPSPEEMAETVADFAERYERKVAAWRALLEDLNARQQRAVIWGAGSKGVTILNLLDVRDRIDYVVDINPRKQGRHVAGTGQEIVAPAFLESYAPDVVIVMNPLYEDEIRAQVQAMGLAPRLVVA